MKTSRSFSVLKEQSFKHRFSNNLSLNELLKLDNMLFLSRFDKDRRRIYSVPWKLNREVMKSDLEYPHLYRWNHPQGFDLVEGAKIFAVDEHLAFESSSEMRKHQACFKNNGEETQITSNLVKLLRAHGGCLGTRSRRRTWRTTIRLGEL